MVQEVTNNMEQEVIDVTRGKDGIKPLKAKIVTNNMVQEVIDVTRGKDGIKPLEALKTTVQELSANDRQLAQSSLLVGVAVDSLQLKAPPPAGTPKAEEEEQRFIVRQLRAPPAGGAKKEEEQRFIVRQVLGASVEDGGILVGEQLRVGQRMRFHIRDAEAAVEQVEDLMTTYQRKRLGETTFRRVEDLMTTYKRKRLGESMMGGGGPPAAGVLLFACVGRGRQLFNQ
ncbi:hypothetical protein T484DRAFT_1859970, partial [Baffinella frigidus]